MPLVLQSVKGEEKVSRLRLLLRFRCQFKAIAAAAIIFIAGGMKIAWSVFEPPSGKFHSNEFTQLLILMWFIGGIFGAIISSFFVQKLPQSVAFGSSGVLCIIGGLLFIFLPKSFYALQLSCFLEGLANGMTQLQGIVTSGEVAHKSIRGLLTSYERVFLWLGICCQLVLTRLWWHLEPQNGYSLYLDQMHGIIVSFLGTLALLVALFNRLESPVMLLEHRTSYEKQQSGDLKAAIAIKHLLNSPSCSSIEVIQMLEDCKMFAQYSQQNAVVMRTGVRHSAGPTGRKLVLSKRPTTITTSLMDSAPSTPLTLIPPSPTPLIPPSPDLPLPTEEFKSLAESSAETPTEPQAILTPGLYARFKTKWHGLTVLKLVLLRGFVCFSLSLPFNRAFLSVSWKSFSCDMSCIYMMAICGLCGCISGALLVDRYGRRKMTAMALFLGGIFILIAGDIFRHFENSDDFGFGMWIALAVFLLFFQFIICSGLSIGSTVYLSEAFPRSVKPKCLAVVLIFEKLSQIGLTFLVFNHDFSHSILFFINGLICVLLTVIVVLGLPETKQASLYECLLKF